MDLKALADTALVEKVRMNHAGAFDEVFKRYWEHLYVFALKRLKDEDEAKDAVQDVFIGYWQRAAALELTGTLEAYLFSAVRYEVLRKIASASKQEEKLLHYTNVVLPEFIATLDPLEQNELMLAIDREISALPARLKEIYQLSKEENLSIKEIALRLNLSEQTVKNQLSAALKKLRAGLKEAFILILLSRL
ncbi:RNA polymerase sigma factor [Mucilaginibacter paludis]|uniref:RNA polymerase, sigma-24 subunit, ECF subfamily n=1 Tax=Mucilaginibacter paludis DSM 18603 TaxID=714943 RepID=H1Y945_9SPHI|nr:sigma-70 family RNA polymerase sigma factor [Mucilaginibacter paludis]EHQ29083.1 RNA polymerase, sigma-24 subunit, ECF subfamily [Mucilaginibacter paludis DSM 18603]